MKSSNTHKLVSLLTVAEQGTFVLLLVLDKRLQDDQDHYYEDADNDSTDDEEDDDLDVNIEALTRRTLCRLCGELTLLEDMIDMC